jgi:hypothetical protein
VPGLQNTQEASRQEVYLPTTVFDGDGIISATSWVAAFYRGQYTSQFSPKGGMIPMKAFHSEQDLLIYARHSSPAVVARPAIVPYINSQLEALDMLLEEDATGTMWEPIKAKGMLVGKKTPQLYTYNLEARTDTIWKGPSTDGTFIPAAPIRSTNTHSIAEFGVWDDTDIPDEVNSGIGGSLTSISGSLPTPVLSIVASSSSTASQTCTSSEERDRRTERAKADVPPLPCAAQDIHLWVDNLAWLLLSGKHWCHDGIHACEILVTISANKTLSMDLLTLLKKCATSHKTQNTIDAAQSLLSEEVQGVNGMELIKKGLGFELCQKRVKTAFRRNVELCPRHSEIGGNSRSIL